MSEYERKVAELAHDAPDLDPVFLAEVASLATGHTPRYIINFDRRLTEEEYQGIKERFLAAARKGGVQVCQPTS